MRIKDFELDEFLEFFDSGLARAVDLDIQYVHGLVHDLKDARALLKESIRDRESLRGELFCSEQSDDFGRKRNTELKEKLVRQQEHHMKAFSEQEKLHAEMWQAEYAQANAWKAAALARKGHGTRCAVERFVTVGTPVPDCYCGWEKQKELIEAAEKLEKE